MVTVQVNPEMNLVPFTSGARKKKACLMLAEMHLAFPLSLAEKTEGKVIKNQSAENCIDILPVYNLVSVKVWPPKRLDPTAG